jgi:hypothetical protein
MVDRRRCTHVYGQASLAQQFLPSLSSRCGGHLEYDVLETFHMLIDCRGHDWRTVGFT